MFGHNGWKLDSQSDNTWPSKVFLNEFVGRQVLGLDIRASINNADAASVNWLTNTASARPAFSDQIIDGIAIGSEYYPARRHLHPVAAGPSRLTGIRNPGCRIGGIPFPFEGAVPT